MIILQKLGEPLSCFILRLELHKKRDRMDHRVKQHKNRRSFYPECIFFHKFSFVVRLLSFGKINRRGAELSQRNAGKLSAVLCASLRLRGKFFAIFNVKNYGLFLSIDHILQIVILIPQIDAAFEDRFQIRHIKRPALAAFDVIILLVFLPFLRHRLR